MGLPRGFLRGPTQHSPQTESPVTTFFKVNEGGLQGFGVYCCCFPSLLVFTLVAGEILIHVAEGLLEGFWEALVVSHLVAS